MTDAVELLAAQVEGDPSTEPVDVGVLNWPETLDDAQLHRVTLGDVHIPDSCVDLVFEVAPQVSTLVLEAIDAAVDGPRHIMIANRV